MKLTPITIRLFLVLTAFLFLALIYFILSMYLTSFIESLFVSIILTISWSIFSGYTGYYSFATATFFGLGAYTSIFVRDVISFPVAVALGGCVSAMIGLFISFVTLRLKGLYFAIFSFVINLFFQNLFLNIIFQGSATAGITFPPLPDEVIYFSLLIVTFLAILTLLWMRNSLYGLAITSIGQDELKAETIGVNTLLFKALTLSISAALAGMAGSIWAQAYGYIDPQAAFTIRNSLEPTIMAFFGGLRTFWGPILGPLIINFLSELLITKSPTLYYLILGLFLIIVIVFCPDGIFEKLGEVFR
jgi:branched-chain amino acid transport system permease protein